MYPKGMVVTFYSADGKKTVMNTLTAKYGKSDKAKNLYIMRGNVQVVNVPKQQRMNTEELFFDKNKQLIYTDSAMFVKVETPTEIHRRLRPDGQPGLFALQHQAAHRHVLPQPSGRRPTGLSLSAANGYC